MRRLTAASAAGSPRRSTSTASISRSRTTDLLDVDDVDVVRGERGEEGRGDPGPVAAGDSDKIRCWSHYHADRSEPDALTVAADL